MPDTRRELAALQTLNADNSSGDISAQDFRDSVQSVHPDRVVQTGTFANLPSSGRVTGDLYYPTDSPYLFRWNGSAWMPTAPNYPMTLPINGDFSWVNQGSAAVDATYGPIDFTAPALSSSLHCHIRKKVAPTPPYTITVALQLSVAANQTAYGGLCFRQASDGKMVLFGLGLSTSSSMYMVSRKMTDATTLSADYQLYTTHGRVIPSTLTWMRMADDNTNRIFSFSPNGRTWIPFHTVGRTDFLTADEVGFYLNPYDGQTAMSILSWVQG